MSRTVTFEIVKIVSLVLMIHMFLRLFILILFFFDVYLGFIIGTTLILWYHLLSRMCRMFIRVSVLLVVFV